MNTTIKRAVAAASLALITGLAASPGAFARETATSVTGQESVDRLGSCIATKKKADILFVVDESASLRGHNGPATDPENIRVDAASYLMQTLGQTARDFNASINVKLAGFGETYSSDSAVYGDWVDVGKNPEQLDKAIAGFAERNDQLYTNYSVALNSATAEIANHSETNSCRSILFFTDGKLTVPGDSAADQQAKEEICSNGGVVEQLRHSGIQLFTVGLIPGDEDSPAELLRDISETNACGPNARPNGAFFNATDNAAGLFAAFRGILPHSGSAFFEGKTDTPFTFTLDNSITDVRISAQPTKRVKEGSIIPTLTAPSGESVDLVQGKSDVGSAQLVTTAGKVIPGMVDVDVSKLSDEDWAGQWEFGYRSTDGSATNYQVQMQILPGLHLTVDELSKGESTGLSSDQILHVRLLDKNNEARQLEGKVELETEFVSARDGRKYELGKTDKLRTGSPAEVSLSKVEEPTSGELVFKTNITTAGQDGRPGTLLSPLVTRFPVSIVPANMPKAAGSVDFTVDTKTATVDIPVEGPGKLWLAGVTPETMSTPENAKNVRVSSPHNSPESAVTLAKGEKGVLPITIETEKLADGPMALSPKLGLESLEGDNSAEIDVAMTGTMHAPVNKAAFSIVMIVTLILALLIPLLVLYVIKRATGVIPRKKIYGYPFRVQLDGGSVVRPGQAGEFTLNYDEIKSNGASAMPTKREVRVGSHSFKVVTGMNPFTSAFVVAEQGPSVADTGATYKGKARLPKNLLGHWVFYGLKNDPNTAEVLVLIDLSFDDEQIQQMVRDIRSRAASHFDTVARQREAAKTADTPARSGKKPHNGHTGGSAPAAAPSGGATDWDLDSSAGPFGEDVSSGGSPFGDYHSDGSAHGGKPAGNGFSGGDPFGNPSIEDEINPFGPDDSSGPNPFGR